MVCLHISITHVENDRFHMTCDNLKREDATEKEIKLANIYEQALVGIMAMDADKIVELWCNQTGPASVSMNSKKE